MKAFMLVLLTMSFACIAKADTVDYFRVYYNEKKIKDQNFYGSSAHISIKASDIKPGDSVTLKYFRDTPCWECATFVEVFLDGEKVIIGKGRGTGNAVSFAASDLLRYKSKTGKQIFHVYYYETGRIATKSPIFYITLN